MNRCSYCKKAADTRKTATRIWTNGKLKTQEWDYCSPSCKDNIHAFVGLYNRFAPRFFTIWFLWALLMLGIPLVMQLITGNRFYVDVMLPAVLALMGAALVIFPVGIVTRSYYERMGIKYTTWFIRLTALMMVAAGIRLLMAS